jgi:hypothetical protein
MLALFMDLFPHSDPSQAQDDGVFWRPVTAVFTLVDDFVSQ